MTRTSVTSILSLGIVAPLWLGAIGCSSADDNTGGGAGTTSQAGAMNQAGSMNQAGASQGGSSNGGSSTGGSSTGGASPGGMCAAAASPVGCSGIRADTACAMEGQACAELPCGVSDVGRRTCNCTGGTWMCTACVFPMDYAACPIMEPPATPLEACAAGVGDKVACASTRGERCSAGAEVCICWPDDEGMVIWDCDRPPMHWAAAAP